MTESRRVSSTRSDRSEAPSPESNPTAPPSAPDLHGSIEPLAIFPLASIVLFPGLEVPLFIFEPRYRAMIEDVLQGARRIGMVGVPPEQVHRMQGDPEVYRIGCSGDLRHCARRSDGTYDIVLRGSRRFEIVAEPPRPEGQLYRTADVRLLDDRDPDSTREELRQLRNEVDAGCRELLNLKAPHLVEKFGTDAIRNLDDETFVNAISMSLDFTSPEKQSLLEAPSVLHRYEALRTLIQFGLAAATSGEAQNPNAIQ